MNPENPPARKRAWSVDKEATEVELGPDAAQPPADGGRTVFLDEHGQRRRLPADLGELSRAERDAALGAMSRSLGAGPQSAALMAAIERLTELHAAGKISAAQYAKERARLESLG